MVWPVWVVNALISLGVSAALNYVSFLLAKPAPGPAAGNVDGFPVAAAGAPIPVVFGTRLLASPNVVWWGDTKAVPIIVKQGKK